MMIVVRSGWACVTCGGDSGSIELSERGELRRETFTGVLTLRLDESGSGEDIRAGVVARDAAAIYALDAELVPWWCPMCGTSYCGDHWIRWDVFDNEYPELHDSVRGRCPEGHERMLED
jgi:hypothetical protein